MEGSKSILLEGRLVLSRLSGSYRRRLSIYIDILVILVLELGTKNQTLVQFLLLS